MDEAENPYKSPVNENAVRRETRIYAALAIVLWLMGSLFVGGMQILLWPIYAEWELPLPFIVERSFLLLPALGLILGVALQVLIGVFSSLWWKPLLQATSILLAVTFFMAGLYTLIFPVLVLMNGLM